MSRARTVFIGLTSTIAVVAATYVFMGRGTESTDDATIEGRIINISSRVSGQVQKVAVTDNQLIEAGAPLVELDSTELQARLVAAQADLSAARAGLKSAESDIVAAQSRYKLAGLELSRVKKLRADGVVAAFEVDSKQAQYDQAKAAYEQAVARLGKNKREKSDVSVDHEKAEGGNANTASQDTSVGAGLARVEQAEAALKLAEVNLSYAQIVAPSRGVVSRRSVEAGQMVAPLTPLLALVDPDDIWVVANFKEDQIREMHSGQKAIVRVDAYGRREFSGHVESLSGATGSKFALLPPDNASGNFVKVVQRIPVLIRIDKQKDGNSEVVLRPGMSAFVKVIVKEESSNATAKN